MMNTIYKIEFMTENRGHARTFAKYLVEQKILYSAQVTPCDFVIAEHPYSIKEYAAIKVTGLTALSTAWQEICNLIELSKTPIIQIHNYIRTEVILDELSTKNIIDWCKAEEAIQDELDASKHVKEQVTEVEVQQTEIPDDKENKLPAKARAAGMTLKEYKRQCNENTAAHWNMSYSDYQKAAREAKKQNMTVTDYLLSKGYVYMSGAINDIKASELDDIAKDNIEYDSPVYHWCMEKGLTVHQFELLTGKVPPKKESVMKPPKWATELGLNTTQYHIFRRMGNAASWQLTLREYDDAYNTSKEKGTFIEDYLASIGCMYDKTLNTSRKLAAEFMNLLARESLIFNNDTTDQEINEQSEVTQSLSKREEKLPNWAKEQGLTMAQYERICHINTAKRWGISLAEYLRAKADCSKYGMTTNEYLKYQGYTFNSELKTQTHGENDPIPGQLKFDLDGNISEYEGQTED